MSEIVKDFVIFIAFVRILFFYGL